MNAEQLNRLVAENGLIYRGGFNAVETDQLPNQDDGSRSVSLLLFGQAGNSVWSEFSRSPEYSDGLPHPLDRWSERIGRGIATQLNGKLLLPFGGEPFHPFLRWAQKVESVHSSKLGLLIHPSYGLWHAYRFAIASKEQIADAETPANVLSACVNCKEQPCLSTCPVDAFNGESYDVEACYQYLQLNPDSKCHTEGCQARDACPEGSASHYDTAQKLFHMKQFQKALGLRFNRVENS